MERLPKEARGAAPAGSPRRGGRRLRNLGLPAAGATLAPALGATDEEVRRPLPGDQEIPKPTVQSTRAITIAAPPSEVWPWIAQIGYVGYGRAGWYAFDFWDANAGRGRSSWRLLPEAQRLQVGLRIGEEGLIVRSFQANQHLVMAYHYPQVEWVLKEGLWPKFGECSFVFVLQPTGDGGTRLLVRTRFTLGGLGIHLLWWPFFEGGDFLQQWRMLPGIKRRAEGLSGGRSLHSVPTPR